MLTRRRLVSTGLLAMGTATLIGVPAATGASTIAVWGLDPDGGHGVCGCTACVACRAHASNKIFASASEADTGRAHPHCKCTVEQLGSVESHVFQALFVSGGRRSSVDRRWQWVQAALASVPPIPPPTAPPPSPPTAVEIASPEGPADDSRHPRAPLGRATAATIRAAWIRRLAPGRRVLFVQLDTDHPIEAEISLRRQRKPLAGRHLPTVSGRQTIQIPLHIEVTSGPAELRVRFTDTARGSRHTVTRTLSVPAKQARRR